MSEFKTRLQAQRAIIQAVNQKSKLRGGKAELYGLSRQSIERWAEECKVSRDSSIYSLLIEASDKLFFLANKSQEQVTKDYKSASLELRKILKKINN